MESPLRHTKIVATLGPACESPAVLRRLIAAGVDVVRLNFSHGDQQQKRELISSVRRIALELDKPVSILQDLQGPKIRVGVLQGEVVQLEEGSRVTITPEAGRQGTATSFSISFDGLSQVVRPGSSIYLDDGNLELLVLHVKGDIVETEVVRGGELRTHKGVNLPGANIALPAVTEKDEEDLRFGLSQRVDMVAMSFVRNGADADRARAIMAEYDSPATLIAKIEKPEALDRLPQVLSAFDAVMVARGDLGVELGAEKVPVAQKRIIADARHFGRPVITATQMLESMTHHARPTRAEASDVANAVLDGTDCVMLSGETAIGTYPVETVKVMDRILREAETLPSHAATNDLPGESDGEAFCKAAINLAMDLNAVALSAITRTGRTATMLSRFGPTVPILSFISGDESLARRLNLWRGIIPLVIAEGQQELDEIPDVIHRELLVRGLVPAGSNVVLVGASSHQLDHGTDFVRLLVV